MKNAFIIHGTGGYPEENWFPWLKEKLQKLDYRVFVPQFPTPKNQDPEHWFQVFKEYKKYLNHKNPLEVSYPQPKGWGMTDTSFYKRIFRIQKIST